MAATNKITSPVVELKTNDYIIGKRISNSFNFNITQATPEIARIGLLTTKPNFDSAVPKNWIYNNIDCQSGDTKVMFEYDSVVSKKDFGSKWHTQYFNDGLNGFAIIGVEKQMTIEENPDEIQTVIYGNLVDTTTNGTKFSIRFESGILPHHVIIRYDIAELNLNLVVLSTGNTATFHSFSHDMVLSGNPLTLSNADFTHEFVVKNWLGPSAISPNGCSMLVYDNTCDYCQIMCLRTLEFSEHKFKAYDNLFGTHTIHWMSGDEPIIRIDCYSGQLIFNTVIGNSEFVKHNIQTVLIRVKHWKYIYSSNKQRTIHGLQWRMPAGVCAQPMRTFEIDELPCNDEYDIMYAKTNKSIPRGNIGLDGVLMFENDFVAVFQIGSRTVIGFSKQLQQSPVIYQLADKFKDYTICAITSTRIIAYILEEDNYEDYGFYGHLAVISFPYKFTTRITSLSRLAKVPAIPFGALRIITKFLEQQKKD
jgi:hypothetical protein